MTDTAAYSDPHPPRPRLTAQVLLGVFVIIIGVLFTLDNLEVLNAEDFLRYWPAGLVALGGLKLWHASRQGQGWFGGLLFMLIGAVMLIERIVYIRFDLRDAWPLVLVFLGAFLVWRGFGRTRRPAGADSSAHISGLAIMGGFERRSNSPAFDGGDLTAILGGCEVDLRRASIAPGTEALIDVFAFWGGIDIKVPEDWTLVNRVVPLMGGVEDKTSVPQPPAAKRLVLRGIVVMGGVSVKN
jgi:predicted membrane protein